MSADQLTPQDGQDPSAQQFSLRDGLEADNGESFEQFEEAWRISGLDFITTDDEMQAFGAGQNSRLEVSARTPQDVVQARAEYILDNSTDEQLRGGDTVRAFILGALGEETVEKISGLVSEEADAGENEEDTLDYASRLVKKVLMRSSGLDRKGTISPQSLSLTEDAVNEIAQQVKSMKVNQLINWEDLPNPLDDPDRNAPHADEAQVEAPADLSPQQLLANHMEDVLNNREIEGADPELVQNLSSQLRKVEEFYREAKRDQALVGVGAELRKTVIDQVARDETISNTITEVSMLTEQLDMASTIMNRLAQAVEYGRMDEIQHAAEGFRRSLDELGIDNHRSLYSRLLAPESMAEFSNKARTLNHLAEEASAKVRQERAKAVQDDEDGESRQELIGIFAQYNFDYAAASAHINNLYPKAENTAADIEFINELSANLRRMQGFMDSNSISSQAKRFSNELEGFRQQWRSGFRDAAQAYHLSNQLRTLIEPMQTVERLLRQAKSAAESV